MTSLLLAVALMGQSPAPMAGDKATADARMIAKRRAKKVIRHVDRVAGEASAARAEAAAIAQARKEYREALPYMLEARRQDMMLQAAREQAAATRYVADSISRSAGYAVGAPPQPPRIVNLPGQPYAP